LFEVGLEFAGLPETVFWVGVAVVPCQGHAFAFYLGS
jgi:hypothetical protein